MKPKKSTFIYRLLAILLITAVLSSSLPVHALTLAELFGLNGDKSEETTAAPETEEETVEESETEPEVTEEPETEPEVTEEPETEPEVTDEPETEPEITEEPEEPQPSPISDAGSLSIIAHDDGSCSIIAPIPDISNSDFSYIWQTAADADSINWLTESTTDENTYSFYPDLTAQLVAVRCGIQMTSDGVEYEPAFTEPLTFKPSELFREELRPDYSWYSENETLYVVNARQLYALSLLVNGLSEQNGYVAESFEGKTVRLDRDIYINEGDLGFDLSYAPIYGGDSSLNGDYHTIAMSLQSWLPIGSASASFEGTFDGCGHTVAGLFIDDSALDGAGLFGYVNGEILNLTLSDFYIHAQDNAGAIAGVLSGIMVNCGVRGGIFTLPSDGNNAYTEASTGLVLCDGTAGALAGRIDGTEAAILNSYSDAYVVSGTAGGIAGSSAGRIENCYSQSYCSASSCNPIAENNGGTIANCFALEETEGCTTFDSSYTVSDGSPLCDALNVWLTNDGMAVSQARFWELNEGRPIPTRVEERLADYDTSWFFEDSGEYIISDKYDLLGLSRIVEGGALHTNADRTVSEPLKLEPFDFAGLTVKLSADIALNDGDIVTAATHNLASLEVFTSIGIDEHPFSGTFDGGGHTISAMYSDGGLFGTIAASGTIINLKIDDSCIFGSGDYVGAFASRLYGVINRCESLSTVASEGANAGGIAGCAFDGSMIVNSINRGDVKSAVYAGGIAGSSLGTVINCYNSAAVEGLVAGGIIGSEDSAALTENCLDTANGVVCGNLDIVQGCYTELSLADMNVWVKTFNQSSALQCLYWSDANGISFADSHDFEYGDVNGDGNDGSDGHDANDGEADGDDDTSSDSTDELIAEAAVKDGRSLRLFDDGAGSLETFNDVFTVQFTFTARSDESPILTFADIMPDGASIIMTVRTGDRPIFYYYICDGDCTEIPLTAFVRLGKSGGLSDDYYQHSVDGEADMDTVERLLFVFDVSACTGIKRASSNIAVSLGYDEAETPIGAVEISFISPDSPSNEPILSLSDPVPPESVFGDVSIEKGVISGSVGLTAINLPENNPHFDNKSYILSIRITAANGDAVVYSAKYKEDGYASSDGWTVLPFTFAGSGGSTFYSVGISFPEDYEPDGSYTVEQYLMATDDPRDASDSAVAPLGGYEIGRFISATEF